MQRGLLSACFAGEHSVSDAAVEAFARFAELPTELYECLGCECVGRCDAGGVEEGDYGVGFGWQGVEEGECPLSELRLVVADGVGVDERYEGVDDEDVDGLSADGG